ncbi:MAG TPA: D-amino-acid transaminase [Terricaulis sp.]|nr:D-amino-acid transaminase [Terricaulis sp.]
MSRLAYVNGAYLPLSRAAISIQDRGFQFADSIYEVWAVRGGRLCDREGHLTRLWRSLSELRMAAPMGEGPLLAIIGELMRRNRVRDGIVYLQISRGAAPRDHGFPPPGTKPTIVITAKNLDRAAMDARAAAGVSVISAPDERWARRDIKSTNLLPNVLARQAAREAGAFEAWLLDEDGFVTEGTSSNAWIVDADGRVRTRALSNAILHGVTRAALLKLAPDLQLRIDESPFTLAEAKAAREAFLTGASNAAVPVIAIDGSAIGDGKPGPITAALRALYLGAAAER